MVNKIPEEVSSKFEMAPIEGNGRAFSFTQDKKRYLIGQAENCDIILKFNKVTAIHAVIEVDEKEGKIFDLSSNGETYVNGKKIVVSDLKIGDKIKIGEKTFEFRHFVPEEMLPPILDMLDEVPRFSDDMIPPPLATAESSHKLPAQPQSSPPTVDNKSKPVTTTAPLKTETKKTTELPRIKPIVKKLADDNSYEILYPLAMDPKADSTEYIFEDLEILYPIFKYTPEMRSVEVTLVCEGKIYDISYFTYEKSQFYLKGFDPHHHHIELPVLGKNEKLLFLDIDKDQARIHIPDEFDYMAINSMHKEKEGHKSKKLQVVPLMKNDLIKLRKNNIEFFIRQSEHPPHVHPAPMIKRDRLFRSALVGTLFTASFLSFMINQMDLSDNLEHDKEPEKVVKILYQDDRIQGPVPTPIPTAVPTPIPTPEPPPVVKKPEETPTPVPKEVQKIEFVDKKKIPLKKEQENNVAEVKKPDNQKHGGRMAAVPKKLKDKLKPGNEVALLKVGNGPSGGGMEPPNYSDKTVAGEGNVDTYQPTVEFSGKLNSILSKGSVAAKVNTDLIKGTGGTPMGIGQGVSGGTSDRIKISAVQTGVDGLSEGNGNEFNAPKGMKGLSNKKGMLALNLPQRVDTRGSIDPEAVKQILREYLPEFRLCYQKQLDVSNDKAEGTITFNFVIGGTGNVVNAALRKAEQFPDNVQSCILDVLKGIKFPRPMGGGRAEFSVPMNFYSKSINF